VKKLNENFLRIKERTESLYVVEEVENYWKKEDDNITLLYS
jgi:hypothetical protein